VAALAGNGGKPGVVRLPARPIWLAGRLCEAMCRPLGVDPPIHRRRVEFFTTNRTYRIAKARALLGSSPRVGVEDGLRRTAEWYRSQGLLCLPRGAVTDRLRPSRRRPASGRPVAGHAPAHAAERAARAARDARAARRIPRRTSAGT